jgi:hypothetical protein
MNNEKYLVVEWLLGNPIIDGAEYFDSEESAIKSYEIRKELADKLAVNLKISFTICKIRKGEDNE